MTLPFPIESVEITPVRTDDVETARRHLLDDGAAILTGMPATPVGAIDAAKTVLGGRAVETRYQFGIEIPVMLALKEVFDTGTFEIPDGRFGELTGEVREWAGFFTEFLASRPVPDHTQLLPAHVDGYALGEAGPDYIFQTFEQQSDVGGDSILIDAVAMVDALAADPANADLAEFCRTAVIDNTEPGLTRALGRIATDTPSGRVRIVRHVEQAPNPDAPDHGAQAEMIARWQDLVEQCTRSAAGFVVRDSETLCLDNYRVLHARQPYTDVGRQVYVSWSWTADALALPSPERLTFAAT